MDGLREDTEASHALYRRLQRPDHHRVHDDPPLHFPGEDIEDLRQAAGPPDEGGVEPAETREDIHRVALEELDISGAGGNRLLPGTGDRLRPSIDRVDLARHFRRGDGNLPGSAPDVGHPVARANTEFCERDRHDFILCRATLQSHCIPISQ